MPKTDELTMTVKGCLDDLEDLIRGQLRGEDASFHGGALECIKVIRLALTAHAHNAADLAFLDRWFANVGGIQLVRDIPCKGHLHTRRPAMGKGEVAVLGVGAHETASTALREARHDPTGHVPHPDGFGGGGP